MSQLHPMLRRPLLAALWVASLASPCRAARPDAPEELRPDWQPSGGLEIQRRVPDASAGPEGAADHVMRVAFEPFDVALPMSMAWEIEGQRFVEWDVVAHRNSALFRNIVALRGAAVSTARYRRDLSGGIRHDAEPHSIVVPWSLWDKGSSRSGSAATVTVGHAFGYRWLTSGRRGFYGDLGAGLALSLRAAGCLQLGLWGRAVGTVMSGGSAPWLTVVGGAQLAVGITPRSLWRLTAQLSVHRDGALAGSGRPLSSLGGRLGIEWGTSEAFIDHALWRRLR